MSETEKIRAILDKLFEGQEYEACEDFMEAGLLDSMEIMDLVEQMENAFGIEISGRDILPENFKNLESIKRLAQKYIGGILN